MILIPLMSSLGIAGTFILRIVSIGRSQFNIFPATLAAYSAAPDMSASRENVVSDTAKAGIPIIMASVAADTVPEYITFTAVFAP